MDIFFSKPGSDDSYANYGLSFASDNLFQFIIVISILFIIIIIINLIIRLYRYYAALYTFTF